MELVLLLLAEVLAVLELELAEELVLELELELELEVLAEVAVAEQVPELEPLEAAERVHSDGCPTLGRTAHATPGFAGSQQYDAAP